nr:aldehyde dehydrogenase (NADP(+)) [Halotalea alkalilenta]
MIDITGHQLIAGTAHPGPGTPIDAIDPASGEPLAPAFPGASLEQLELACQYAAAAFDSYRETSLETRAAFLERIASEIEALGDELIVRAMRETGLPRARLSGERARTCGQLRLFARVVRDGEWLDVRLDRAQPERQPLPKLDHRLRKIGLGPVAVFGASNFPLAFSVAGGDTASALAAGCPVVVKAHGAHPGTSELVGRAIQRAVSATGLPAGVFALLHGSGREIGTALVADARIKAAGFTGSRSGGTALWRVAQGRAEPIPFYAEMSSVNPVFMLPAALEARDEELAQGFAASLTGSAGQLCTNPGLVIALAGPALERFKSAVALALAEMDASVMLSPGIHRAYVEGRDTLGRQHGVREVASSRVGSGPNRCQAGLFAVDAATFLASPALHEEVFGATSLVIECDDQAQMSQIAHALEGQLTATLILDDADLDAARELLPVLERKAGRILANGFPTGVEVCDAMVHGGPYPATSDSRTTSVGTLAIERFLRPVCYQNLPAALLPQALADGNPLGLVRLVDGKRESH